VLVVPEWWGVVEYPKVRARQLAEMGYVAFVADMFGQGRTTTKADEASDLSGKAYQFGVARLAAPALAELRKMSQVESARVAAIGFCFGGATVADMIRHGADLQAGVSFHGGLSPELTPATGAGATTPLLVLHGGADPMVPPAAIAGYVQRCVEAGVPISFVSYPQAVHAFSNPDADRPGIPGVSYNEPAATASWRTMQQFLEAMLGG
jgi:dienelactone hydrolase